jgi:F0F1-type ATP synthase assembly protein I
MNPSKTPPELGLLLTLGWGIAVWITGGVILGRWADNLWGWQPWGTLGGALVGMFGAGATVYRIVRKLDRIQGADSSTVPDRESKSKIPDRP